MACCAAAAYLVFRFLGMREQLLDVLRRPEKGEEALATNDLQFSACKYSVLSKQHSEAAVLSLGGLTCGSCVTDIQILVKTIPGITHISISLALLRAHVIYNETVSLQAIIDTIRPAGYEASPSLTAEPNGWGEAFTVIQESVGARERQVKIWQRAFTLSAFSSLTISVARYLSPLLAPPKGNISIDSTIFFMVALSLIAGARLHLETCHLIWNGRKPNMSTLGSLGILSSLLQSVITHSIGHGTIYHGLCNSALGAIPIISTSVLGGRLLKAIVSQRSFDFGLPLIKLIPSTASVLCEKDSTSVTEVPINMLSPGDRVVILQGDQIPGDGVVESQDETTVLEAWMNGSNIPRVVSCGDTVFAGSRVEHGTLNVRVQSCGRSTRLGKILDSIVDAEVIFPEAPPGNHIQHFVTIYLLLTTVVCVGQLWYASSISSVDMLGRASAMLLAACPCALSLSLPTVKLLATGS